MFVVGPLVLILVIAAVAIAVASSRAHPRAMGPRDETPAPAMAPALRSYLERWTAAGLVTEEQTSAIEAYEAAALAAAGSRPPTGRVTVATGGRSRMPAAAEALGYLGGILAVLGVVLVVVRYWPDLGAGWRVALAASATALLWMAGTLVRSGDDDALTRFRMFVWTGATASSAVVGGVVAADVFGADAVRTIVLTAAAFALAVSGAMLWQGRLPAQQLTLMTAVVVVVGQAAAHLFEGAAVGLSVWVAGVAFVAAGVRRVVPRGALTALVGAVSASVGAMMVASAWEGPGLFVGVATAFALLALALVPRLVADEPDQVVVGVVGAILLLQVVPGTLGYYARDAGVAVGLGTWAVGCAAVYLGVRRLVRMPVAVEAAGGIAVIGGAALTGVQARGFASLFGVATALVLLAFGMSPGRILLSLFGSIGLLINVLWAITWFFPGEGRVPLLISAAGMLILATAVLLTRLAGRGTRGQAPSAPTPKSRPPTPKPA